MFSVNQQSNTTAPKLTQTELVLLVKALCPKQTRIRGVLLYFLIIQLHLQQRYVFHTFDKLEFVHQKDLDCERAQNCTM